MDVLPKLALKRAGEFICSLGSDTKDSTRDKSPVKWIQKDTKVTVLDSPKEILEYGYEKLKYDPRWVKKQKEAYHSLMEKLSNA